MGAKRVVLSAECWVLSNSYSKAAFAFLHSTKHLALSTIFLLLITGCTAIPTPTRIALLAPFEGRYREVGYEALYAARLALQDADTNFVELLPLEDGGSANTALMRANALRIDPAVSAVLVLGYAAVDPDVLTVFGDLPVLVIGDWGAQPISERVYILSNPNISDRLTVPERTEITDAARMPVPFIGGEILALTQLRDLRDSLDGITIISSAALPDAQFAERYTVSDSFAPEPGLLASLSYDAARLVAQAVISGQGGHDAVNQNLHNASYSGLNGEIQFMDGYWADAPIHEYAYDESGALLPIDDIVE
jgi:ABC-type branched-subunit amino acid transport system substrate-binding protein